MIVRELTVPGKLLRCDACKTYEWVSIAKELPVNCPSCRSREWNGKKTKRRPARGLAIELPKPKRIKQGEDDHEF